MYKETRNYHEPNYTRYESASAASIAEALSDIDRDYGDSTSLEYLDFHNSVHTEAVIERSRRILAVLKRYNMTDAKMESLGDIAAAFHDIVQKSEPETIQIEEKIKVMRKRFAGANESESAQKAIEYMQSLNQEAPEELFSPDDMTLVERAIETTVPSFSSEENTVYQQSLTPSSGMLEKILALADLNACGAEIPTVYLQEGNALFREENIDIKEALAGEPLAPDTKTFFRDRILTWSAFEIDFTEGRKNRFATEVTYFPKAVQQDLTELFNKFDENIAAAKEQLKKRQTMSFEMLLQDMGYKTKK